MSKLVYGKGINDRTRPTLADGKNVKEYDLWTGMLERCFSEKSQTRYPTYKSCSVSDNFLNYSFFYDWCQGQIGFGKVDEKGRSWCLDKDLLFIGNKTYSETTCVFHKETALILSRHYGLNLKHLSLINLRSIRPFPPILLLRMF